MNANITTVVTALAALGVCALAIPAHAGALNWSGDVDDTATVALSGRNVRTTANAGGIRNERTNFRGVLPRDDVRVRLDRSDGRGNVRIVQQPNSRNNYTTLVRIVDKEKGRSHYSFTLNWDNRGNDGRGRDRGGNEDSRKRWDRRR